MLDRIKQGYIGTPSQLVTLRRVTLNEGRGKGSEVIEITTAGGFSVDILPDAGLDIGQARYKGINMSWMCRNGYDSPAAFSPFETEFEKTFPGGLMYTCGLRSAGPANRDNGEYHPLHGRYHGLQAQQICARVEGDEIVVSGIIRETALFGHCLELKRTLRIPVWGASVTVNDSITNLTPRDEEYMIIYHCNFGYPLLSEHANLVLPERETIPRTPFAKAGLDLALQMEKPVDNEEERVYFHLMKQDYTARLCNSELGVCMTISWSGDTLPNLTEWRSMSSGDYVLALEPTNCFVMGRAAERENGTLKSIKAFETIQNTIKIDFSEVKHHG